MSSPHELSSLDAPCFDGPINQESQSRGQLNPVTGNSVQRVLVTGGAGYIGSHTTLLLLQAGLEVVVLDSLCNASFESLRRVQSLTGRHVHFVNGDIRDRTLLDKLLSDYPVQAALHFAGLKAVAESVRDPLTYYETNVGGTINLCQAMAAAGVFKLVFSSSATVYGDPVSVPISEDSPAGKTTNPYGTSKWMAEQVLTDLVRTDTRWSVALLRYFNPVGAHESGQIGEDPRGIPNNLLPYMTQVAVGKRPFLAVYGTDYPTPDGTGVRDYIHVMDLAEGHLKALYALNDRSGAHTWNLGTGQGVSVLQMISALEATIGRSVPYQVQARRPGDVASCYANPEKAAKDLGWQAKRDLNQMMRDAWNWQQHHPNGYPSPSTHVD